MLTIRTSLFDARSHQSQIIHIMNAIVLTQFADETLWLSFSDYGTGRIFTIFTMMNYTTMFSMNIFLKIDGFVFSIHMFLYETLL